MKVYSASKTRRNSFQLNEAMKANIEQLASLLKTSSSQTLSLSPSMQSVNAEEQAINLSKEFVSNLSDPFQCMILYPLVLDCPIACHPDALFQFTTFPEELHSLLSLYLYKCTSYTTLEQKNRKIIDLFYRYVSDEAIEVYDAWLSQDNKKTLGQWFYTECISSFFQLIYKQRDLYTIFVINYLKHGLSYLFACAVAALKGSQSPLECDPNILNRISSRVILYLFHMSQNVYVCLDIGGTLTKVLITSQKLSLPAKAIIENVGRKLSLYFETFHDIERCLTWLKQQLQFSKMIKVAVTGGGAVKYDQLLTKTFSTTQILKINEYGSNIRGLSFISKHALPIVLWEFVKTGPETVLSSSKKTTLSQCTLPFQFISLGSGVNYQIIDLGENGFERRKLEKKTFQSQSMVQGTCLGGGYIFGILRLLSQECDPEKLIQLIQQNDQYRTIYDELVINLMQTAVSLSFIHQTPTILANGSILRVSPLFKEFQKAMLLSLQPTPFKRSIISLDKFQGYLGTLGLLYNLLNQAEVT